MRDETLFSRFTYVPTCSSFSAIRRNVTEKSSVTPASTFDTLYVSTFSPSVIIVSSSRQ